MRNKDLKALEEKDIAPVSAEVEEKIAFPEGQSWLLDKMVALGYPRDPIKNGACSGIAFMALQAILLQDIKTFDNRLKKILEIPIDNFKKNIDSAKEEKEINERDVLLEILAFFDGIAINQHPQNYPELFEYKLIKSPENIHMSMPLTLSNRLNTGITQYGNFSGAYSLNELTQYFESLSFSIENLTKPFGLILNNNFHSIVVGYDPASLQWQLIDANQLPSKNIPIVNSEQLAKEIFSALNLEQECDYVVLNTNCYANTIDNQICSAHIRRWKNSEKWKELHNITADKIDREDSFLSTLLTLTAIYPDLGTIHKLISLGANVNQQRYDGVTPLQEAAVLNYLEIARLLLENNADVNHASKKPGCALFQAVLKQHVDMVKLLLEYDADPILKNENGEYSSLDLANKNGYLEIALLLEIHHFIHMKSKESFFSSLFSSYSKFQFVSAAQALKKIIYNEADETTLYPFSHIINRGELKNIYDKWKFFSKVKNIDIKLPNNLLKIAYVANYQQYIDDLTIEQTVDNLDDNALKFLVDQLITDARYRNNLIEKLVFLAAAARGHLYLVQPLLEFNPDLLNTTCINKNASALLWATYLNKKNVVEFLLTKHPDIHLAEKNNSETALHWAAKKDYDTTRLLLEAGADVNITDKNGKTPLDFALEKTENRPPEVLELLLQYGAVTHQRDNLEILGHYLLNKLTTLIYSGFAIESMPIINKTMRYIRLVQYKLEKNFSDEHFKNIMKQTFHGLLRVCTSDLSRFIVDNMPKDNVNSVPSSKCLKFFSKIIDDDVPLMQSNSQKFYGWQQKG